MLFPCSKSRWLEDNMSKQLLKHRHMFVTHAIYCSSKDSSATYDCNHIKYVDVGDSQSFLATLILIFHPDRDSKLSSQHTVSIQYNTIDSTHTLWLNCWSIVILSTDVHLSATSSLKSTHFWAGNL